MKQKPSNPWERLATVVGADTAPLDEGVPLGFTARLLALRREARREARREESLRRWSFWSLRAACASVLACVALVYLRIHEEPSPILISPPGAEFVAVPLSNP